MRRESQFKKHKKELPQSCQENLPWLRSYRTGNWDRALSPRTEMSELCRQPSSHLKFTSRIYSLIHLVALNKIICTMHQEGMCFPMLWLCLLNHTQQWAWVPEPNLCIVSTFTWIPKTTILIYLFSFKLRTDRLSWPRGDSFPEHASWASGLRKEDEILFWSHRGWVWVLALILTSYATLCKSLICSELQRPPLPLTPS